MFFLYSRAFNLCSTMFREALEPFCNDDIILNDMRCQSSNKALVGLIAFLTLPSTKSFFIH